MPGSFTLSLQAADILAEDLQVDLRQFPFEIGHGGATLDERARLRTEVYGDLQHRRFADRGEVDPEVHRALTLLHTPEIGVAVVAVDVPTDEVFRARIAVSGNAGVLAIQQQQRIRFDPVDPRGLVRVCTGLLSDVPAGHLESATVSTTQEQQPTGATGDDADGSWLSSAQATATRQAGGAQLRKVQRIMALPVQRVGYFFVTGRDDRGDPVRLPAIGWRDTEQGRYSVTTRRNNDGETWNTFTGADKQRLAAHLGEQLRSFQQR
ncbi:ESAT-6 protein secretion system EspG family protein [Halopolyspora algeriensis]|uniref:ESAT-6 protein secretion system EspG family protein n=1 Tax=Halopolyspora algeriensis TaxID=1500506 RepID=A0A368VVU2_9ACTN|nr:ESX secretion-associated protein EspG [Halopolyspora algeriensis]RCW45323.1 ESAT-6 protein secretion system EspG family protein [Halopolyspora algeriensis]TQM47363.1 ESAT-6 protein secretion system EspG family protein [Halopolyspora algeriensis]